MILAVDAGNTTVAAGCFAPDGTLRRVCRVQTRAGAQMMSAGEYAEQFSALLDGGTAEGAILSSVVPETDAPLRAALRQCTGHAPLEVSPALETGFSFGNYDIRTLGADRIADLSAAVRLAGAPVIVFDLGSCTTASVLDGSGVFLGGLIQPGVQMSLRAMHTYTGKLPLPGIQELPCPDSLIGADTAGCMYSGALLSAAAVIEAFTDRVEARLGRPVPVLVTGGASVPVLPWCRRPGLRHEPDLLFLGLYELYRRNLTAIPQSSAK